MKNRPYPQNTNARFTPSKPIGIDDGNKEISLSVGGSLRIKRFEVWDLDVVQWRLGSMETSHTVEGYLIGSAEFVGIRNGEENLQVYQEYILTDGGMVKEVVSTQMDVVPSPNF